MPRVSRTRYDAGKQDPVRLMGQTVLKILLRISQTQNGRRRGARRPLHGYVWSYYKLQLQSLNLYRRMRGIMQQNGNRAACQSRLGRIRPAGQNGRHARAEYNSG